MKKINKYLRSKINSKHLIYVQIIGILLLAIGSTYALNYLYETISASLSTANISVVYVGDNTLTSNNMIPIASSDITTNAITATFSVKGAQSNPNIDIIYDVSLSNIYITEGLINSSFQYKLYKNSALVSSGDFSGLGSNISNGSLQTYERAVLTENVASLPKYTDTADSYTLYVYILDNELDQSLMMGQVFSANIQIDTYTTQNGTTTRDRYTNLITPKIRDGSRANSPVLADGMIPVMYDTVQNSWVKADYYDSTSEYAGYDYQNKKWANAVMVNNNAYIDLSGNGYTINISGATSTNEGLSFDGVNDYAYIPNVNYNNSKAITIDFVAKIDSSNTAVILESSVNANTNSGGFFINTREYGKNDIAFNLKYNNNAVRTGKMANNIINVNELKHYTITFDSTKGYDNFTKIYLNAVSKNITNIRNDDLSNKTIANYPLYIGSRAGSSFFTKMVLSELRIYNRELSQSEIQSNEDGNIVTNGLVMSYNFTEKIRDRYMDATPGTPVLEADILAYWVWIPRYKYQLFNVEFLATNPQTINIEFESQYTQKSTGTRNGTWLTHPAFTFGEQELPGFWIGKFEVSSDVACTATDGSIVGSGCNLTTINPKIKPGVTSWRGATPSTFYLSTFNMDFTNYLTSEGVNEADIRVLKNMEWGAVAYLSYGIYGKNSEITQNDNSSYYTGGGVENAYVTNVGQSTTGNITGVYDMSGGSREFVMGVMEDGAGTEIPASGYTITNNYHSGFTGKTVYDNGNVTGVPFPNSKYYDLYAYGTTRDDQTAYNRSKLGDATGETRGYNDFTKLFVGGYAPWFLRGHSADGNSIFNFDVGYGHGFNISSSRFSLNIK